MVRYLWGKCDLALSFLALSVSALGEGCSRSRSVQGSTPRSATAAGNFLGISLCKLAKVALADQASVGHILGNRFVVSALLFTLLWKRLDMGPQGPAAAPGGGIQMAHGPSQLRNGLLTEIVLPHSRQESLSTSWNSQVYPGAVLADAMGLGKTRAALTSP